MPFKRRSSRILNRDSKSTAPVEYLEISDTEPDHHEDPSEASPPRLSSYHKSSGKTDFHFRSIKFVWETYQKLKRCNASASVLRECLRDNDLFSEEHLVQSHTLFCSKNEAVPTSSTPKASSSRKGKEKVGETSTPSKKESAHISPKPVSVSKYVIPDDDARLFDTFEMKVGIASSLPSTGGLFRSNEHNMFYKMLLARGVINHRAVDFGYLEKA